MGITQLSLNRINKYIDEIPNNNILIVGCQNLYNSENYGEIAADYYREAGYNVKDIDICGCNGSEPMDLRNDLKFSDDYALILQHGTIEHIDGSIYMAFKNMHEACILHGVMIHENPKTKNWLFHGNHYFIEKFYVDFAKACGYDLIEVTSEAAMSNDVDGWNVCAVLRKMDNEPFISELLFNKIYKKHVYGK